jgi:hypothetical protein
MCSGTNGSVWWLVEWWLWAEVCATMVGMSVELTVMVAGGRMVGEKQTTNKGGNVVSEAS